MISEGPAIPVSWNAPKTVLPGSVVKITRITWDNDVVWDENACQRKIKWFRDPNLQIDFPTYKKWTAYKITKASGN